VVHSTDQLAISEGNVVRLHHVRSEYLEYYHHERIHQGINRIIAPPYEGNDGETFYIERLSGLLKFYHRQAA